MKTKWNDLERIGHTKKNGCLMRSGQDDIKDQGKKAKVQNSSALRLFPTCLSACLLQKKKLSWTSELVSYGCGLCKTTEGAPSSKVLD